MKYTELKEHFAKNGESIKEQLRARKYRPQPVRRVEIPKPDGGVRNLGVPTVTDRFIQQAIAQVLTPIYEEQFHEHSYGFRPNRCAQQAILTALDMMNEGNDWIVDIDLEKFFDTVNHYKLITIIGRTIKDGEVISIVRKYLVSGIMIDDEYEDSIYLDFTFDLMFMAYLINNFPYTVDFVFGKLIQIDIEHYTVKVVP